VYVAVSPLVFSAEDGLTETELTYGKAQALWTRNGPTGKAEETRVAITAIETVINSTGIRRCCRWFFFTLVAIVCGHVFVFVFVKPLLTLTSYALSKLPYDEKKAIGRFPSGRNLGSGIFVSYPPSKVDASYQGSLTTTEGGDQFLLRGSRKGQSG